MAGRMVIINFSFDFIIFILNGSIISVVGKTTVEIIELFKYTQKVP
ncbi:protein of unknown function [Streptococcus thermophilus]|nr:protein of unknown function [Streptococcus thermophilus]CAD0138166.1 protein of unknown function [Streptococcus thermophilus]CAD0163788.1 protein of unknown function [Streptococcus thermophilus]CAD0164591.1 protein of unknown function [Streptococcus thermophilus]CAD0174108.1 protein of unknown function [Streptococcus thermophilus]